MRVLTMSCLVAMFQIACAAQPPQDDSLYHALGERSGITQLVEQFLREIAADPVAVDDFRGSNIERIRRKQIEFICALTGGPCTYTGETMAVVHAGLGISDAEFNAVVTDLIDAMTKLDIPVGTQNRLLARLAPLYNDVVEHSLEDREIAMPPARPAPTGQ